MEEINEILAQKITVSEDLKKDVAEFWSHPRVLKRNEYLSKEGDTKRCLFVVDKSNCSGNQKSTLSEL